MYPPLGGRLIEKFSLFPDNFPIYIEHTSKGVPDKLARDDHGIQRIQEAQSSANAKIHADPSGTQKVKRNLGKIFAISIFLALCFAGIGLYFHRHYFTLSLSDFMFAWEDNKHVELSRPETGEEYYNRWLCFSAHDARISDAIIEYNSIRTVPLIEVRSGNKTFQFNVDPEIAWDVDAVQARWRALVNGQDSICFFSVYSETDPDGTEVRYIRRLKSSAGIWDKLEKPYRK
jgi:hypothetical protein